VPLVKKLPKEFHFKLGQKIQRFREQITVYGSEDQEITDEMELAIAAQACLLVLNSNLWYYGLKTVVIYPGAFKSKVREFDGTVMHEYEQVRLGESWLGGPVVLSWRHSEEGAADISDGHNLVLHEFAHQIDDTSGATDAMPALVNGQSFDEWRDAFQNGYDRHLAKVKRGRRTVVDQYGATHPVEFFAVSVEAFFEQPEKLSEEEPEIYEQMQVLFGLDPKSW